MDKLYPTSEDLGLAQTKSITDFERGRELAKLAPHAEDSFIKECIIAQAANLILGYDFLSIPKSRRETGFRH